MLPILADYLNRLEVVHADMRRTLEGLPQEALDWSPGPDISSIAVLAAHTAGALRYWIGDVAGQAPSGRDRSAEFRTQDVDAAALIVRLDAALDHSRSVLERLALPDLEATRISLRDGKEYTIAWALAHALEHTAVHLGHMHITRQLWDHRETPAPAARPPHTAGEGRSQA
ncbi:MAG TPA: DUF664 domain-containing protein [Anaerolineae bacterium]|nr:DUF664 domain-containing protein [Anaerolineae bacterium]